MNILVIDDNIKDKFKNFRNKGFSEINEKSGIYQATDKLGNIIFIPKQEQLEKELNEISTKYDHIILDLDFTDWKSDNAMPVKHKTKFLKEYPINKSIEEISKKYWEKAGIYYYIDIILDGKINHERIHFFSNNGSVEEKVKRDFRPKNNINDSSLESSNIKNTLNKLAEPLMKVGIPINETNTLDWIEDDSKDKYITLRRGIIEGCNDAIRELEKSQYNDSENIPFSKGLDDFKNTQIPKGKEYFILFFEALKTIFPLQKPCKAELKNITKRFIKELTSDWEGKTGNVEYENNNNYFKFCHRQMKILRNWISHGILSIDKENESKIIGFIALHFLFAQKAILNSNDIENFMSLLTTKDINANLLKDKTNEIIKKILNKHLDNNNLFSTKNSSFDKNTSFSNMLNCIKKESGSFEILYINFYINYKKGFFDFPTKNITDANIEIRNNKWILAKEQNIELSINEIDIPRYCDDIIAKIIYNELELGIENE